MGEVLYLILTFLSQGVYSSLGLFELGVKAGIFVLRKGFNLLIAVLG